MQEAFTVALIQNSFLHREFDEIIGRCRQAGYAARVYDGDADFASRAQEHPDIDALLCMGGTPFPAALLQNMPRLRALLSAVTGTDGFDIDAATQCGIVVGNGQTELNYIGMAESTIMLILACLYRLDEAQDILRRNLERPSPLRGRLLRGKRLGFIGFGRIAQEMAARLAGWDIEMRAYVHRPNPHLDKLGIRAMPLEELLAASDIVSLHCSLNANTRHLLNAERLALLRPDSILVNTARGALIDEAALAKALGQGDIGFAALDTFEHEPLPAASPLRGLTNVILTPHMIGHTAECNQTLLETAWTSLTRVAAWQPPVFIKNPDVLARWGEAKSVKYG